MNELDQEKHNIVVRQCCDLIDEKRVLEDQLKHAMATHSNYAIAMDEILRLKNVIAEARYYLTVLDPNKNINGHISYLHTMLNNALLPNVKDHRAQSAPVHHLVGQNRYLFRAIQL